MEKVLGVPAQVLENGVTVIKEVTGKFEPLVLVKVLIVPVPERGINPVSAVELVQLYWVFDKMEPEKVTGTEALPLQIF